MKPSGRADRAKDGLKWIVFLSLAMALISSCSLFKPAYISVPVSETEPDNGVAIPMAREGAPGECLPDECLAYAVGLKNRMKNAEATTALKSIKARFPETLWSLRASFVLGAISAEAGSTDFEGYFKDALRLRHIEDHVLLRLAGARRRVKDLEGALDAYNGVIDGYPQSSVLALALYEKGLTLAEAGRYAEARRTLGSFIKDFQGHAFLPDALLKTAEMSWRLGDEKDALKHLRRIRANYPQGEASKGAETLAGAMRAHIDLTREERFVRAKKLFLSARYNDAINEFSRLAEDSGDDIHDDSVMHIALSQIRLRRFTSAENTLKGYLKQKPPLKNEAEALYQLAVAAFRAGDSDLLVRTNKTLAKRFPEGSAAANSLMLVARLYEENGEVEKAVASYREVVNGFKGSSMAMDALWRLGWMEYAGQNFTEAFKTFSSCLESPGAGKDRTQFIYWSGRAAEKAGGLKDAARLYRRACKGALDTYYCHLATERLSGLLSGDAGTERPVEDVALSLAEDPDTALEADNKKPPATTGARGALFNEPRLLAAKELIILGLGKGASNELSMLVEAYKDDRDALLELASLYYEAGDYYHGLTLYKRFLNRPGTKGPSPVAQSEESPLIELSFPMSLVESIKRMSPLGGVDPYLVAAVMREESEFNPEALSKAGAIGLMQVMPKTGEFAARETGSLPLKTKDLYRPDVNIRLGSWYLGHLSRRFGSDLVLTIAGYNAGPGVALNWAKTVKTRPMEADEFVESIPYAETRYYVKRVLKSYREYLRRAGLMPKQYFPSPAEKTGPEAVFPFGGQ